MPGALPGALPGGGGGGGRMLMFRIDRRISPTNVNTSSNHRLKSAFEMFVNS